MGKTKVPTITCPRCQWRFTHVAIPNKQAHQQEWSRAFEPWTQDEYLNLMRLWRETDKNVIEIAVEMGRPPASVEKKIKDFGIIRPDKAPAKPDPESIAYQKRVEEEERLNDEYEAQKAATAKE